MSVQFVAEISSNHHQDLARCLRFIDVAAEIGCAAVKFQLFTMTTLFAPEILATRPEVAARAQWELPVAFLPALSERCHMRGILFTCTPFSLNAVEQLLPYVDGLKIASYELPWDALLRACAQTGKPLVLSTGMATIAEIDHAVSVLDAANGCTDLTLLHCASAYPTPVQECNLRAIATMQQRWVLPVGWSDHSRSVAVISRAVHRWQASMIEFHLDLDGTGNEYATGHCWLPAEILPVIAAAHEWERADGDGIKQPVPSEDAERAWRRDPTDGLRPLVATRAAWMAQHKEVFL